MKLHENRMFWIAYTVTAFVIIGFLVYGHILNAYFVSDDWHWLYLASQRPQIIPNFFANYEGGAVGGSYNPIVSIWFNALYAMFGLKPYAFHVASLLLHIANGLLVTVFIYSLLSSSYTRRGLIAFSAGVLFLVWPTFIEAVSWVASVPHVLATFFYLLALISYLHFRSRHNKRLLFAGLLFGFCSLLSKEIAISLPLVIVTIEIFKYPKTSRKFLSALMYFIPVLAFIGLRYIATGLVFGTYAESVIVVRLHQIVNTFLTFPIDIISLGTGRIAWMEIFWVNPNVASVLGLLVVAVALRALWKYYASASKSLLVAGLLSIAPFLALGFNRTSIEAERYTYLPGIFLISLIVIALLKLPKRAGKYCVIGLLLIAASISVQKTIPWVIAGDISKDIVKELANIPESKELVFVGLPDTVSGAHVFRNNLQEAARLVYPSRVDTIEILPVYLIHEYESYSDDVIDWTSDERGYFGNTKDGMFRVTGFDRREVSVGVFELWNYDYNFFTSDTIRLILSDQARSNLSSGELRILTYDNGVLVELAPIPQ